ncbi:MAG: hypothetical protein CMH91_04075 [Oceanicaulis sp.]|uniref:hypothetical protein n=1 Tax=unclassified Oceanicaulis TaxID=2632123 RepID=UPI000C35A6BE|nr:MULTISPECIES: hypothetical protein [unclassified Oceanicaulis]MBC38228.1 hypothetical protein [Oceanicaulis sp.]MBG34249.1 hypothetical protein [Oceanicaulis sp.]HCR93573.1 hypothetical protein [Oceanicaulis sp.]
MSRRFHKRPHSQLSAKDGVLRRGGRLERLAFGERLIISRALCHFETMPNPPGGQSLRRYEAAKLSAKARTPIADPAFHFDWGQDRIGIWSWPRSLTQTLTDFEGEILPETVLHPPLQSGARLVSATEGYEGQVWRDNQLVASRWWPSRPTASDWSGFLRATRTPDTGEGVPEPVEPRLLDKPANPQPYTALLDRIRAISLRDIAALALVTLAVPGLYLLGQWVQLSQAQSSVSAELDELSQQTAEISAARQSAQQAANELAIYADVLNRRHPAALLASVSEELARFSIRLDAFEQTEDSVTLTLHASDDFAPESLVRAMESNPLMNSVSLEPGRGAGEWMLSAQLEAGQ